MISNTCILLLILYSNDPKRVQLNDVNPSTFSAPCWYTNPKPSDMLRIYIKYILASSIPLKVFPVKIQASNSPIIKIGDVSK